ncbi:unnamed protein product [Closterium sp. Naga37s-1]|nr:unnamed protein product [Closterium sp. Naga37s-1]
MAGGWHRWEEQVGGAWTMEQWEGRKREGCGMRGGRVGGGEEAGRVRAGVEEVASIIGRMSADVMSLDATSHAASGASHASLASSASWVPFTSSPPYEHSSEGERDGSKGRDWRAGGNDGRNERGRECDGRTGCSGTGGSCGGGYGRGRGGGCRGGESAVVSAGGSAGSTEQQSLGAAAAVNGSQAWSGESVQNSTVGGGGVGQPAPVVDVSRSALPYALPSLHPLLHPTRHLLHSPLFLSHLLLLIPLFSPNVHMPHMPRMPVPHRHP